MEFRTSEFFYVKCHESDWEDNIYIIQREYDWSEKYHGITWEIVDAPTQAWLQEKIRILECEIESCEGKILEYKELLEK